MARSGSFDFSLNRDESIKDALIEAQVIDDNESISASMIAFGSRTLNRMLKSWQSEGLHLWYIREFTIFLEKNKAKYQLGSTGDHATFSFTETEIKTAASSGDTSIDVDSTSGMSVSDNILIVQDDGNLHKTTISQVTDSDTVVIADATTDTVAVDQKVYFYTSKVPRPSRIVAAFLRDTSSNTDTIMDVVTGNEYWELGVKSTDGIPNQLWFDPKLDNSEVRIYPEPNDVSDYISARGEFPLDDVDSAADDLPLPPYFMEAVHYGLSKRLAASYHSPEDVFNRIQRQASTSKQKALEYDRDTGSMYLSPDMTMR